MRSLLDVNVLIALLDRDHSLHLPATDWFRTHALEGWASCPLTQNGCLRIMSQPAYPHAIPVAAVAERLATATATELHEFWPDDLSLLDPAVADTTRLHGPRQVTDCYLLALAVKHDGCFVTFDAGVVPDAVRGAGDRHLLRL